MPETEDSHSELPEFVPDRSLREAYFEASELGDAGLEALCPNFSALKSGKLDQYRDFTFLGRGALKQVFRTFDTRTERWIALARLREDRGPDFYEAFIEEARMVASLNHPNIIKVHELAVDAAERPYFTMDLKGDATLASVAAQLSRADLLQIFNKICDAVAYAHAQGVVHLDLKPDNIQCSAFGEVLVCDWGLARSFGRPDEDEDPESSIFTELEETRESRTKGTPGYMAPEQYQSGQVKNAQTDVYALGCILHFILTGKPPFAGPLETVQEATLTGTPISSRKAHPNEDISKSLDAVFLKATQLDPSRRYASASALRDDVQNYLNGFTTRAERPRIWTRTTRFLARHRIAASLIASASGLLIATTVFYWIDVSNKRRAVEEERLRAATLETQVEQRVAEIEQQRAITGELDNLFTALATNGQSLIDSGPVNNSTRAERIAKSSNDFKNFAIYLDPIQTINLARMMTDKALEFDPESVDAHAGAFMLDCLQLNYRSALQNHSLALYDDTEYPQQYARLAEAFPEYHFDETQRPSPAQLIEVFQTAKGIPKIHWMHFMRVLVYDHATRSDFDNYESVVEAFLKFRLKGAKSELSLILDSQSDTLHLDANARVDLYMEIKQESILKLLNFSSLALTLTQPFDLGGINNLPIRSLDISESPDARFLDSAHIRLPQLREIKLAPGQSSGDILSRIESNYPIDVLR
ncbi:MAG: serine/threonine-protein kinase [Verrucomicrobiota bacterium]